MTNAVLHILLSLAAEDRHGLGIAADVKAFTGGRLSLGPGTLYGTVKRLLEDELIEDLGSPSGDTDDPRRRYYRLTAKGRRQLAVETSRWDKLAGAIAQILRPAGEGGQS